MMVFFHLLSPSGLDFDNLMACGICQLLMGTKVEETLEIVQNSLQPDQKKLHPDVLLFSAYALAGKLYSIIGHMRRAAGIFIPVW